MVIEAKDHQGLVSEPVSFTLTLTSRDVDGDGLTNQWEEEHELLGAYEYLIQYSNLFDPIAPPALQALNRLEYWKKSSNK